MWFSQPSSNRPVHPCGWDASFSSSRLRLVPGWARSSGRFNSTNRKAEVRDRQEQRCCATTSIEIWRLKNAGLNCLFAIQNRIQPRIQPRLAQFNSHYCNSLMSRNPAWMDRADTKSAPLQRIAISASRSSSVGIRDPQLHFLLLCRP